MIPKHEGRNGSTRLEGVVNIYQLVPDWIVFGVMHGALLLVWVVAFSKDVWAWSKRRFGTRTIRGTALRGERSMNFLYVGYGVATVVYALATQSAEAFCGYRVMFIVLDYLAFTHLFFFSRWFRHQLFVILARITKD